MLMFIIFLVFCTAAMTGYSLAPALANKFEALNTRRKQQYSLVLEQVMTREEANKMNAIFIIAPFIFAAGFYILFPEDIKWPGAIIGFVGGIAFPGIYLTMLKSRTKDKFQDQLVDALMIMSSSFRGGLSLIQAMEAVVEEMPDPINREFGMVLGENKMGVSLEEAMNHLYNRMPSAALQQMITAILLARETGGNLPIIFKRIVNNIRERKKIQQSMDTLTLQGKIQGFVMSLLPIAFGWIVYTSNRRIFEHMISSNNGKIILVYCLVSWIIGVILIWRISSFKEF